VAFRLMGGLRRYEPGSDGSRHEGLLMDLLPEDLTEPTGDEDAV
jgi:aminoglycoside 6'-N-acetyltransferase